MAHTDSEAYDTRRLRVSPGQAAIGLGLGALLFSLWLALHIYGVFLLRWNLSGFLLAPAVIAIQTWLYVGLFIVAHDAIHGTLAPGRPRLNRAIGQVLVGLYAGFRFHRLAAGHFQHHRAPGSESDPDFHAGSPRRFGPWFVKFFRTYFGWPEFALLFTWFVLYAWVLGASLPNLILFWGLPSILSAFQLFVFGTWLPHRHGGEPFVDEHHARSSHLGWWASLITCFHFGYHHEHHTQPHLPWWRLPEAVRRDG